MNILKYIQYTLLIIFLASFNSCWVSKQLDKKRLRPYNQNMNVEYRLVHTDSMQSILYLKTQAKNYRLVTKAFKDFKGKELLFEQEVFVREGINTLQQIRFPIKEKRYVVSLMISNVATNEEYSDVFEVNKYVKSEQTITAYVNDEPLLNSYISKNTYIQLKHTYPTVNRFFVKHYDEKFKAARAPYIRKSWRFSANRRASSIYEVAKDEPFKVVKEGLYFIQADTTSDRGLFINCFHHDFPKLTQAQELVATTRYITKNKEYSFLNETDDTKMALDDFWLERGGTKQRSRELIKLYYSRVQTSNHYFTTYKEGWKTDRGIIFTIFGEPTSIKKTPYSEYWYYANVDTRNPFDFYFNKKDGQFILHRTPYCEQAWKEQVFEWRKGLIQE